ncbi:hypothetical protein AN640_08390 [Candidatus Epulonipiscium fishelsonii]|uniref:Uncharacterized protein n=1 Tax=Candidatus Epulonipiscium fishelsonii TaxID=77094 RepID=A0ACC8XDC2_9FIRM|nr:hypothetical protein AN640_08390 [Epulopiscium sp. SCG-D08WGA-EpuloA1]
MNISIIYGSTTGNTAEVAELIKAELTNHNSRVIEVSTANDSDIETADLVLFGSSTWNYGDIQDDFLPYYESMSTKLLNGKAFAVFGCGDKASFGDVFCQAVDLISKRATECGGTEKTPPLKVDDIVSDNISEIKEFASSLNV